MANVFFEEWRSKGIPRPGTYNKVDIVSLDDVRSQEVFIAVRDARDIVCRGLRWLVHEAFHGLDVIEAVIGV